MRIEKIVAQLKEKEYTTLYEQLKTHKADKFLQLLEFYRSGGIQEKDIQAQLDIKPAAFYTLKSRLYDRIQEFFTNPLPTTVLSS